MQTLNLLKFLNACKNIIKTGSGPLYVILGNQTADMDSTFGSILLAYHYDTIGNQPCIPIINHSYEQFITHFETIHLLENQYSIPVSSLIFSSDLEFKQLNEKFDLSITLYDHNIPDQNWQQYSHLVAEIIDHHEDKSDYKQSVQKNIQSMGSAITLVGQLLQSADEIMSHMILSTIVVDTFNFDTKLKGQRWNDIDWEVFQKYQKLVPSFDRNKFYDHINSLKFSKDMNFKLAFDQIMQKDYKQFTYGNNVLVGYSIIFLPFDVILEKYPNIKDLFNKFKQENKLTDLVIMFVYPKGQLLERQILLMGQNEQSMEQQIKELDICRIESQQFILYKDNKSQYSRKIIEPLIGKKFKL